MVTTTEIAQLSRECNAWRETLRSWREEFSALKNRLQDIAARQTDKDVLCEVEHLDNQIHIQIINIHDLRQIIKGHQRLINGEMATTGTTSEDSSNDHEQLFDDYQNLTNTLHNVKQEFNYFITQVR